MPRPAKTSHPAPPELSDQEILALLKVAKAELHRDWLIFRLVIEHSFTIGEIVGSKRHGSNLPGIQIEDLRIDSVWLRRGWLEESGWERIGTELMRELKEYAGQRTTGILFDIGGYDPVSTMALHLRQYAKIAKITKPFSPLDLRGRLTELQVRLAVFEPEIAAESNRMTLFFALNYGLERTIRKMVFEILLKKYGDKWWDRVPSNVRDKVEKRRKEDRDSPKIIRSIEPLDYTTFPELKTIIEANWEDFRGRFPHGRQKDISGILEDLGYGRILIAHSCELPEEEKARFELRFGDWFRSQEEDK